MGEGASYALPLPRPSRTHGSTLHTAPLLRCLLARTYNAAAGLLEQDIFKVVPALTGVTPTDLQLYCYYGGMVAAGASERAGVRWGAMQRVDPRTCALMVLCLQGCCASVSRHRPRAPSAAPPPTCLLRPPPLPPPGRKQWSRALELWLQAVTAPTFVGNAITVACYHKYVLASLIHAGVQAANLFRASSLANRAV